eukprot:INCI9362.1.p1 GENE.INCI9362.1~~INCI9362.1.p1  ORF type:complete len:420 (+),score=105.65 INCI9362.1:155-1414(+)
MIPFVESTKVRDRTPPQQLLLPRMGRFVSCCWCVMMVALAVVLVENVPPLAEAVSRTSNYQLELQNAFSPRSRSGPLSVPIGSGAPLVQNQQGSGAGQARAGAPTAGRRTAIAANAAANSANSAEKGPHVSSAYDFLDASGSFGAVDSADDSSGSDGDDSDDSFSANPSKNAARRRVLEKAREAESLTNQLILGVKSVAALTSDMAHKLTGVGDDALSESTSSLRSQLRDLLDHEKALSATRSVVDQALADVKAAEAAANRAKKEGASAKDVAMTAAAESAIAANAEWMRAIQQLVEVRATMAGALTTAKSFLDPARAATASAQFTATAASLQQIQAEVEKVKTLAVMADLAGKKIGITKQRALSALKKLKDRARSSSAVGPASSSSAEAADEDAASAAQSIDDQLAVDKGIVESLNVE